MKRIKVMPLCGIILLLMKSYSAAQYSEPIRTMDVPVVSTGIVVDGFGDDSDYGPVQTMQIAMRAGSENPAGLEDGDADDFNATFKAAWDENYLYLFVEVTDDIEESMPVDGANSWTWDNIEIYIDLDTNVTVNAYDNASTIQIRINRGEAGITWPGRAAADDYLYEQVNNADGWIVEVGVPWTAASAAGVVPDMLAEQAEGVLGFDLDVCDADGPGGGIEGGRNVAGGAMMFWDQDTPIDNANNSYQDRLTFGFMTLAGSSPPYTNMRTFKFLPLPLEGFRYIRFESYYSEDTGQVNVYEIQAYSAGTNVARNKSGKASSYSSGNYETNGKNAVDGNTTTGWSGNRDEAGPDYAHPHFIVIDLEQKFILDSILLNIEGPDGWDQTFSLLASPDTRGWYVIGSGTVTTGIFTYHTNIQKMIAGNDTVTIYNYVSVTDTLRIDAELTGLEPPDNINTIRIFPNPAKTHIIINTGNYAAMEDYSIRIVNQTGMTVYETLLWQQEYEINLSDWTGKGLYFVRLYDAKYNLLTVKKLVIF